MNSKDILNRLILLGGPPRSGTTFAARSLNFHPHIMTAIDDHVYECWGLYYYRTRVGLIQQLRNGIPILKKEEVQGCLWNHLVKGEQFKGIAPSAKTSGCELAPPASPPAPLPSDSYMSPMNSKLVRHWYPLNRFEKDWYICLKSPEISFVLPSMAMYFPGAKFVLVYRPIIEIAESMYRIGEKVKRFPVYHKRWEQETHPDGTLNPPPGVPDEWSDLWNRVLDFQRCIIYAASYMSGLLDGLSTIPAERFFIYNHAHLRYQPREVFEKLAHFLNVEMAGFQPAINELKSSPPGIPSDFVKQEKEMESHLSLKILFEKLESLKSESSLVQTAKV